MIGVASKNEKCAAASALSLRFKPAMMVTPEREMPGSRAKA